MENPVEKTKQDCWDLLAKCFVNNQKISLKDIIARDLKKYTECTTDLGGLGVCLIEKDLVTTTELEHMDKRSPDVEKSKFLYLNVLIKKVENKKQYAGLFTALFDSGNKHIVELLFESLSKWRPSPQACSVSGGSTDAHKTAVASQETPEAPEYIPLIEKPNDVDNSVIQSLSSGNASLSALQSENIIATAPGETYPKKITICLFATIVLLICGFGLYFILEAQAVKSNESITTLVPTDTTTQQQPSTSLPQETQEEALENTLLKNEDNRNSFTTMPESIMTSEPPGQIISRPEKIWSITIGSPADVPDGLPDSDKIHLTINNFKDFSWKEWAPQNAIKVTLLRLLGTFTTPDIRHLLFIMSNLTVLCAPNLNENFCEKHLREDSILNQSQPKNNRQLTIGAPTDLPDYLPKTSEIHLTLKNLQEQSWQDWSPENTDMVALLRLYGAFSLPDIRHFLSIMENLKTLCIDNNYLFEELCEK